MVSETTAGATTYYVRDAAGALILQRTPTAGDFYYVYDGQGSVIALVDPSGVQWAAYACDPYGDHATATATSGSLPPNPWRWIGGYLDPTGLYKMGARYYDPVQGRFTQLDPVAGGSANGYDYCAGDPVNCSDRSGTKRAPALTPVEQERLYRLVVSCSGPDAYGADIFGSAACDRFRSAFAAGDLSEFGIASPRISRISWATVNTIAVCALGLAAAKTGIGLAAAGAACTGSFGASVAVSRGGPGALDAASVALGCAISIISTRGPSALAAAAANCGLDALG
jgi:RHS repeat-associated protein